jgi:tetratricopeptide (TPR) repeat protein
MFDLRAATLRAVFAMLLTLAAARAEPVDELIAKGDVYAAKYQSAEALKAYLAAETIDPKNAQVMVRISREYRHLMSDAKDVNEKLRLGGIAVEYAKRAAALGPDDCEAQLAIAICYGKLQPYQGSKQRIDEAKIVKEAADKAIKIDPKYDLAWHIEGRWNLSFAEVSSVKRALAAVTYGKLPVTTFEDAARAFEKAIELNPNRLMHYIELGRTYIHMGRLAEARRLITKGLSMHETEKDDPETKREGRDLLAKCH